MKNYITNCPNCGAPLRGYGKCEFCGTIINQPVQVLSMRPGLRKLVCQTTVPMRLGEISPEAAASYVKNDIKEKMADALTDSIKFITSRKIDPCLLEEVITVRGELLVPENIDSMW